MKIAILGATSQIAKDLIISFANYTKYQCLLFSRDPLSLSTWLINNKINEGYLAKGYDDFSCDDKYDAIINFVGIGDPSKAKDMGSDIFNITYRYDMLALNYLKARPNCKYIFLSSGAVYGDNFAKAVDSTSVSQISINNLDDAHWYTIAKLYAEARHRSLSHLPIYDVRVFNYFSSRQNITARFLISDIIRSIKNNEIFSTTTQNITRDFITPIDFFNLIKSILQTPAQNMALDCYTKEAIDKLTLLQALSAKYGLKYKIEENNNNVINATGFKEHYYSKNLKASTLGYIPLKTSLEGLLEQIDLLFLSED